MISYKPLWETMEAKRVSKRTLRLKHHIGGGTMQRLKNGLTVSTHTLDILCKALECQLSDVAEFIPDETIISVKK